MPIKDQLFMLPKPELSIVLSFRNEEACLPELITRLEAVLTSAVSGFEMIFVNDASTDASLSLLEEAHRKDPRVKILTMSRRFGVVPCVLAGLSHAQGQAVVMMDCDLQDPPELIAKFVEKWRAGFELVYTVRSKRIGEPWIKRLLTKAAYRVLENISDVPFPVEAGDFRLMDRKVVEALLHHPERDPYLRGLIMSLGFKKTVVEYERQPRLAGQSHFPLFGSLGPAKTFFSAVFSFSPAPLLFFLGLGFILSSASFVIFTLAFLKQIQGSPSGLFWLAGSVGLLFGIQNFGLGVLGIYVWRILEHSKSRPAYIIAEKLGFTEAPSLHAHH